MGNWSILNFPTDPTPGDAGAVETMSSTYNRNGQTFSDLSDFISAIGRNPDMVGDYAEKFASEVTPLISDFRSFGESFEQVGTALGGWAAELPGFQRISLDCLQRAEAAEADRVKFNGLVSSQRGAVRSVKWDAFRASDEDQSSADRRVSAAENVLANYQDKLTTAIDELEQARRDARSNASDYETSADRYADTVEAAQDHAPQIAWWETVYYSSAWKVIVQVAVVVAIAATIAGFFFGGWVLPLVGLVSSLLVYSDDVMGFFTGDNSGWELALSTVFLALSGLSNIGKIADAFSTQGRMFWQATKGIYGPVTRFRWAISTYGEHGAKAFTTKNVGKGLWDLVRPGALKWKDLKDGANLLNAVRTIPEAQRSGEFIMGIGKISGVLNKTKPIVQDLLARDLSWSTLFRQVPVFGETEKTANWVRDFQTNTYTDTSTDSDIGTVLRHFTTQPHPVTGSPVGATQPGVTVPDHHNRPLSELGIPLNPHDFTVTPPPVEPNHTPVQPPVVSPAPSAPAPSVEVPSVSPAPAQSVSVPSQGVPVVAPTAPEPAPDSNVPESSPTNSYTSGSAVDLEIPNIDASAGTEAPTENSSEPPTNSDPGNQVSDQGMEPATDAPIPEVPVEQLNADTPHEDGAAPEATEDSTNEPVAPESEVPETESADDSHSGAASPGVGIPETPEQNDSDPAPETDTPAADESELPGMTDIEAPTTDQPSSSQEPAVESDASESAGSESMDPVEIINPVPEPPETPTDLSSKQQPDGVEHDEVTATDVSSPDESSDLETNTRAATETSQTQPEDAKTVVAVELDSTPSPAEGVEDNQPQPSVLRVSGGSSSAPAVNTPDEQENDQPLIVLDENTHETELVDSH